MPLTREQTAGTLTFFFPDARGGAIMPEMTVVVRRFGEEEWHAGIAMCSQEDQFVKEFGRRKAFHRLQGIPIRGRSPADLVGQIQLRFHPVSRRRMFSRDPWQIDAGLLDLLPRLREMRVE